MFEDSGCDFLKGLDFLIRKNYKLCGNPGSVTYQKSVLENRKKLLNKWFNFFPGIHNHISNSVFRECKSYEFECKSDFFCLLIEMDKSIMYNKDIIKIKLEESFNKILKSNNPGVYPILLFLILMQNMKSRRNDVNFNLNDFRICESNFKDDNHISDFVNEYPSYMFSQNNLPLVFSQRESNPSVSIPSFMLDLSDKCSVKSSMFFSTSSGYLSNSETDFCDIETNNEETITNTRTVSYPFSEFFNTPAPDCDNWDEEFMEEWSAFQEGKELPRRFIWEERGCNVGAEKPRMTEWQCPLSVGSGAVCLALYDWRYNGKCKQDLMNAYSVPMSDWINDLIMLRLGLSTSTFKWDNNRKSFQLAVKPPKYLLQMFEPHLKAGTIFARLNLLIDRNTGFKPSIIRDGLVNRLSNIITLHREVLSTFQNAFSSVLEFNLILQNMTNQLEYLGDLFEVSPHIAECWPEHLPNSAYMKRGGLHLLKYFYQVTVNAVLYEYLHMTFYILEGGLNVVLDQLENWIYRGQLSQEIDFKNVDDFFILSSKEISVDGKDERWWHNQFSISERILELKTEWIFDQLAVEILRCGKSIKLLNLIENSHGLLYNAEIVKNRPPLKLLYDSDNSSIKKMVEKYVQVTKSIEADTMKSQKDLVEEKRRKAQLLRQEAQRTRDMYLSVQHERMAQQNFKNHTLKLMELDRLKKQAIAEKERKLQAILEEKRNDKLLLEKSKEQSPNLEELKYELTSFYAKKISDVEARERAALERIEKYESRMLKARGNLKENVDNSPNINVRQSTIYSENVKSQNPGDDNGDTFMSYAGETRLPNQHGIESALVNEGNASNKAVSKMGKLQQSPKKLKSNLSVITLSDDNKTTNQQSTTTNFVMKKGGINKFDQKVDSTAKELMYPGDKKFWSDDKKHIPVFRKTNIHGHTTDSNIEKHTSGFRKINIHGHTADSTIEKAMYPDSQKPDAFTDNKMLKPFHKINVIDSTIQEMLYPESHLKDSKTNELKSNLISKEVNQKSSKSNSPTDVQTHLDKFKNINTKGHVSQSSVQELMYPLRKEYSISSNCTDTMIQENGSDEGSFENQTESMRISKLLNGVINHSEKLREESIQLASFRIYNDDIFRQLDRSICSFKANSKESQFSLDQPVNIDSEPIDLIINKSLLPIIRAQVSLVDSSLMFSLLNTHKLRFHLKEMRRFLFLKDGKFSDKLLPKVFNLLSNRSKLEGGNVKNQKQVLADLLSSALSYITEGSEKVLNNSLVHLTGFYDKKVKYHNLCDDFCISYKISWPVSIVIQQSQIWQYQSIFRAIVQIKYAGWCLQETRQALKSWFSSSRNSTSLTHSFGCLKRFHSCLMEMEHWVRSIDNIFCNHISGIGANSWQNLTKDLVSGKITNLDSLIESHAKYLDGIMMRCVLAGDQTQWTIIDESMKKMRENIRKILIDLLGTSFTFYRLVSLNRWNSDHTENNEKISQLINNLHKKFRAYGDCLLKILKAASHDSFLEHLFVSLNYNQFYYQPTLV